MTGFIASPSSPPLSDDDDDDDGDGDGMSSDYVYLSSLQGPSVYGSADFALWRKKLFSDGEIPCPDLVRASVCVCAYMCMYRYIIMYK